MSLRIRRGTEAQRTTIVFDMGEIVYTTDSKKLYIGDGVTTGGTNVLLNMAGAGVTYNPSTQALDFTAAGLTTSSVNEGSNKYFTTQRAQDAAASLFTAVGSPTSTGTIGATTAPSTVTVSSTTGLAVGERFVVAGTGGGGLTAGTYYIESIVDSTHILLASSLVNAQAGTAITSFSSASISGTTWTAGGTDSGITFAYDSINHVMNVTSTGTGLMSVVADTAPSLGGNLSLKGFNISGTGNITLTGSGTFTGAHSGNVTTSSLNAQLGAALGLNGYNITGTGNINIAGTVTTTDLITNAINGGSSAIILTSSNQTPFELNSIGAGTLVSGTLPVLALNSSRGTSASPVNTVAGDYLHGINFTGYYNSGYVSSGSIISSWDSTATLSSSHPASSLTLVTGNNSSYNILVYNSAAVLSGATIQTNSFAGSGAYPTPAAGMIIFDTNTSHFFGYNGTTWKQLDN
jgi:hypothetical protein